MPAGGVVGTCAVLGGTVVGVVGGFVGVEQPTAVATVSAKALPAERYAAVVAPTCVGVSAWFFANNTQSTCWT
ncbi:hypothetical protein ACIA5A_18780 [Micromonospora sp. NPDC051300]|uniref:hypothetical protein n=1 Tax=Micromonospora sp. NPDC051300 TaxID=3364286 RepID=UPI0037A29131